MKKSQNRQKKEAIVASLREKVAKANALTLTNYTGLSMEQLQELRAAIRKEDAEYVVTKNPLIARALSQEGKAEIPELEGQTATLFAYADEVAPLKALVTFAKTSKKPTLKFGYLGKNFLDEHRLAALAALPTKDVLIGQVVGSIAAPLTGLLGVLQANLRNLVYVLNEVRQQKESTQ